MAFCSAFIEVANAVACDGNSDEQFQAGFATLFEELEKTHPEVHKWWMTVVCDFFHHLIMA